MVLLNDEPSKEWRMGSRDHHCELYIDAPKLFYENFCGTLIKKGTDGQNYVAYALQIPALGQPGDEYD
jgi:hypothetical protein